MPDEQPLGGFVDFTRKETHVCIVDAASIIPASEGFADVVNMAIVASFESQLNAFLIGMTRIGGDSGGADALRLLFEVTEIFCPRCCASWLAYREGCCFPHTLLNFIEERPWSATKVVDGESASGPINPHLN